MRVTVGIRVRFAVTEGLGFQYYNLRLGVRVRDRFEVRVRVSSKVSVYLTGLGKHWVKTRDVLNLTIIVRLSLHL